MHGGESLAELGSGETTSSWFKHADLAKRHA